jgi:diguanylate cyclase (GGDEF)-like protein
VLASKIKRPIHVIQRAIFQSRSVARWLTALSLAVALGMLALGSVMLFDLRTDAWRKSEQASDNLILALSRDIARNITLYDHSIQNAIGALGEPELAHADPKIRQMALFGGASSAEYLGSMMVTDAKGNNIADSLSLTPKPLNFAFREHFRVHQRRSDVGLFISRPFEGRLAEEPIIALARRVNNPDGSFGGIVVGAMRLAYFHHLFDNLDVGPKGSVTLLRADGRVIMRRPFRPEDIDQDLSATPAFQTYQTAPHGHFNGISKLDGTERHYTFHKIDDLPLYLSVAVAIDDIYAGWWRKATSIGAILVALCAASVTLCLLFRREIHRRLTAEAMLQEAASNLSVMATTDGLTGIPNRRSFEDALAREWRRAIRHEIPISVLMLDVDCFKLFNDEYGHPKGDEVLKSVAACVAAKARRAVDMAARYGGEEFVALLPETELAGATKVAEAIRGAVAALAIPHVLAPTGQVTISVGVAVARPGLGADSAALIKQADDALYEAKRSGRNKVVTHDNATRFLPLLGGE